MLFEYDNDHVLAGSEGWEQDARSGGQSAGQSSKKEEFWFWFCSQPLAPRSMPSVPDIFFLKVDFATKEHAGDLFEIWSIVGDEEPVIYNT